MQYEYRVESIELNRSTRYKVADLDVWKRPVVETVVNELAKDGWEPVLMSVAGSFVWYTFRRPHRE